MIGRGTMSKEIPPPQRPNPEPKEPSRLQAAGQVLPPPLPDRPGLSVEKAQASVLEEEDRLFVERVFGRIRARQDEILARAALATQRTPGPPPLVSGPERKLLLLREELFARDAQLLRLGEIWSKLRSELQQAREAKQQAEEALREMREGMEGLHEHISELERRLSEKEREFGASVDGLLRERLSQEKEMIEVVAGKEREANLLRRDLKERDAEIARLEGEITRLREERSRSRRSEAPGGSQA